MRVPLYIDPIQKNLIKLGQMSQTSRMLLESENKIIS